ncbi:hypothetical protein P154DRAFT_434859 [Amniculicola lignicola CBS 123094]|uniref:Uncharacterized protein n=1 Tax=Amniculicola lignicola CBS 123094 TaxID=1392246 RepID=A0A6A5WNH1_9PLEO|nr:hypothetical protein P154DRAFT_434859 [Amniculicola lignicola CBS 123094]
MPETPPATTSYQQPFDQRRHSTLTEGSRKIHHRIGHHFQRLWLWESISCVVAVATHFGMMALLGVFDGARISSWNQPWTLNSNISLLLTVIKGAALIPIASSIGQLKWRRFWTYRKLIDIEVFDEASRGTLGSLSLLWHLKLWGVPCLGALLTVAALTMDTIAQNVVDTVIKSEVTGGMGILPRSNNYATFNKYTTGETPGDQLPWVSMVTAINFGTSYTSSFFWQGSQLPAVCWSGNCTFAAYQTLGVDAKCRDRTKDLDYGVEGLVGLADGPYLRRKDGILNVSSTTTYPPADLFPELGPLILNFQAIANPLIDDQVDPVAIQCALYWAVGTYKTTNMTNFWLYDDPTSVATNTSEASRTKYGMEDYILIYPPECWVNGTIIEEKDERHFDLCTNWISPLGQLGLQNLLTHTGLGMTGEVYKTENGWSVTNLFANAVYDATANRLQNETYNTLELIVNNTAVMMSQGVRMLPTNVNDTFQYFPVNGTVYQNGTFWEIHFYYLGIVHAVVGGSVLFLILTVFITRQDHPWKTSVLPLLFHGLSEQDRNMTAEVPTMVDMREAADHMKVKVTMTAVGQRLQTRETLASG